MNVEPTDLVHVWLVERPSHQASHCRNSFISGRGAVVVDVTSVFRTRPSFPSTPRPLALVQGVFEDAVDDELDQVHPDADREKCIDSRSARAVHRSSTGVFAATCEASTCPSTVGLLRRVLPHLRPSARSVTSPSSQVTTSTTMVDVGLARAASVDASPRGRSPSSQGIFRGHDPVVSRHAASNAGRSSPPTSRWVANVPSPALRGRIGGLHLGAMPRCALFPSPRPVYRTLVFELS